MVRLTESARVQIRGLLKKYFPLDWLGCDVCRMGSEIRVLERIQAGYQTWFLCDDHAREIGVLW